jgi:hypothetical protein
LRGGILEALVVEPGGIFDASDFFEDWFFCHYEALSFVRFWASILIAENGI